MFDVVGPSVVPVHPCVAAACGPVFVPLATGKRAHITERTSCLAQHASSPCATRRHRYVQEHNLTAARGRVLVLVLVRASVWALVAMLVPATPIHSATPASTKARPPRGQLAWRARNALVPRIASPRIPLRGLTFTLSCGGEKHSVRLQAVLRTRSLTCAPHIVDTGSCTTRTRRSWNGS